MIYKFTTFQFLAETLDELMMNLLLRPAFHAQWVLTVNVAKFKDRKGHTHAITLRRVQTAYL